jgi:protoporphyrinogen oxidase
MTAYLLQKACDNPLEITLLEATERLGGKILTPQFDSAPVQYEAGAAEFYDYSPVNDDPLKELIDELGLHIAPMGGNSIMYRGRFINNLDDMSDHIGRQATDAFKRFHWAARDQITPTEYFNSGGDESPIAIDSAKRFDSVLETITDAETRDFLLNMIHSDLATEPSLTSIEYGLQNYLMNDPAYMQLYGIVGGNEQLTQALANRIDAKFLMNHRVSRIGAGDSGKIRIESTNAIGQNHDEYDFVIVALPHNAVAKLDFAGDRLRDAVGRHHAHYHHPAHYLRITILFDQPFWQGHLVDSYCMLDQLGGCCLYDESSRIAESKYGILGWLLAGDAVDKYGDWTDSELINLALDSLPATFPNARDHVIEGRVHRWHAAVNAMPGGVVMLPHEQRHCPEPTEFGNLFFVGDYLFDSTLNGVLDSAEYVAHWIAALVAE